MADLSILVVAGGPTPDVDASRLPAHDLVIAADNGADHANALGLGVDVLVGDLDSVSPRARLRALEKVQFDTAKDASDLELALDEAITRGASEVTVITSTAGRTDHAIIGVLLLAHAKFAGITLRALTSSSVLHVVRDDLHLDLLPSQLVSIVAVAGPTTVSTRGLHWPLDRHRLLPGETLGLSNVASERSGGVEVHEGVAFVIVEADNS